MIRTRTTDAKLAKMTDDGYLVVSIARHGREMGSRHDSFSVTGELHASKRGYELGASEPHACGCIHDDVLRAFPDLAPIVALHLADAETGEPMHGPSNGWYRLGGASMAHDLSQRARYEIDMERFGRSFGGRTSYYDAPDPIDADGYLSPAYAEYFIGMAARSLGVPIEMLPDVQDESLFLAWVEEVARPRWQEAADEANALIDGMASAAPAVVEPDESIACEEFSATLDAGLRVSARLMDETGHRDGIGWYYQYKVKISAGGKSYSSTFGGSVADADDGKIDAREAAFATARELLMFEHETAREFIEESLGESWEDLPAAQRRGLVRAEQAFDRLEAALLANRELFGC